MRQAYSCWVHGAAAPVSGWWLSLCHALNQLHVKQLDAVAAAAQDRGCLSEDVHACVSLLCRAVLCCAATWCDVLCCAGLSLAAVSYLLLAVILVLELQDKLVLTAR